MADVPVELFRACRKSAWSGNSNEAKTASFSSREGKGSLYPDYEGYTRKDGYVRPPDVTWFTDANGIAWIRGVEDKDSKGRFLVRKKEGVSVSTKLGGMGFEGRFYFLLPQGTPIPGGLDVLPTPTVSDDGHHSIRCLNLLRRDTYEGYLDNLARSALSKAIELKKQSLHFA